MRSLAKVLEQDLDWRTLELFKLKTQVLSAKPGVPDRGPSLRALLAMLYAHFEGFCKFAVQLYLDEIERTKMKRKDLQETLAVFSVQKVFAKVRGE